MTTATAPAQTATLVTQTRVLPEHDAQFAIWQQEISDAVAAFPGLLDHRVIEPSPPSQQDWVIVQRFRSMEAAQAWLRSPERLRLLAKIEPLLIGRDDIHLFSGDAAAPPDASASAVVSTRVAPGSEPQFRAWQRRIATAEAAFPGFQGAKLEPPIPGVQDDWATVVRFDSDTHLQTWLGSPQRQTLLDEATTFGAESSVRTVRGGFAGWFDFGKPPGAAPTPIWKQNMVVLLTLYPVVFLFGAWFSNRFLLGNGVPFWLALFIGNVFSVTLTGYWLISWASRALSWWLSPRADAPSWTNAAGIALVLALYALALAVFSQFP